VDITFASAPTCCGDESLARLNEVRDQFSGCFITHKGTARQAYYYVLAVIASPHAPFAVSGVFSLKFSVFEVGKRNETPDRFQDDVPAFSPIPAIGAAFWDIFFAAEA